MLHKYEVESVIGEGAYGLVLKARNKETNKLYAIKKFKNTDEDENTRKTTLREVKMLRLLKHENIVQLIEAFKRKGRLYLVFNYAEKNMLEVLEASRGGLNPQRVRWFIFQLLRALSWTHTNGIIHRDIKLENLLVTNDDTLLLCDFGFARTVNSRDTVLTEYVATRWYRSPCLLLGLPYTSAVDIFATACVMAELATGDPLFPGDSDIHQLNLIVSSLGPIPSSLKDIYQRHPSFRSSQTFRKRQVTKEDFLRRFVPILGSAGVDLLSQMLDLDESKIISASEALNHPYFNGLEEERGITRQTSRKQLKSRDQVPLKTRHSRRGSPIPDNDTPPLLPQRNSFSRLLNSPPPRSRKQLRDPPLDSDRSQLPVIVDHHVTQGHVFGRKSMFVPPNVRSMEAEERRLPNYLGSSSFMPSIKHSLKSIL
ncbi:hypothetical protein RCL1_000652 [Eukaryota sp. TZLM3-RCL]